MQFTECSLHSANKGFPVVTKLVCLVLSIHILWYPFWTLTSITAKSRTLDQNDLASQIVDNFIKITTRSHVGRMYSILDLDFISVNLLCFSYLVTHSTMIHVSPIVDITFCCFPLLITSDAPQTFMCPLQWISRSFAFSLLEMLDKDSCVPYSHGMTYCICILMNSYVWVPRRPQNFQKLLQNFVAHHNIKVLCQQFIHLT